MARAATAVRDIAVKGMRTAAGEVTVRPVPPAARLSVRATQAGAKKLGRKLGVALPNTPSGAERKGTRHALWLGPDEWMVYDDDADAKLAEQTGAGFATVDISHRNVAFLVEGADAAAAINCGCPRDLSTAAFPVGTASRTVLGKAEIVLYRLGREKFRVECWRSFAPYVFAFLKDAVRDAHL